MIEYTIWFLIGWTSAFLFVMLIDNFTILRRNPYNDPRIDDEKENI